MNKCENKQNFNNTCYSETSFISETTLFDLDLFAQKLACLYRNWHACAKTYLSLTICAAVGIFGQKANILEILNILAYLKN